MAEREGRADPGRQLVLTCAPAVALAAKSFLPDLAARIGPRYDLQPFAEVASPLSHDHLDVKSR